jgi:hypothetical protein
MLLCYLYIAAIQLYMGILNQFPPGESPRQRRGPWKLSARARGDPLNTQENEEEEDSKNSCEPAAEIFGRNQHPMGHEDTKAPEEKRFWERKGKCNKPEPVRFRLDGIEVVKRFRCSSMFKQFVPVEKKHRGHEACSKQGRRYDRYSWRRGRKE